MLRLDIEQAAWDPVVLGYRIRVVGQYDVTCPNTGLPHRLDVSVDDFLWDVGEDSLSVDIGAAHLGDQNAAEMLVRFYAQDAANDWRSRHEAA